MALPTIEKTWQFDLNNYGSANTSVLLGVKNALKSFPTNPWTVWGSGNTVDYDNGGGTDYWNSTSDLHYSGTSYSWIVLQQSGLGAKTSLLLATNSPSAPYGSVILSFRNGYGAANGGSDGTAGTRPTSTDEYGLAYNSASLFWSGGYYHVMQSTDGECTRVFAFNSSAYLQTIWIIDRPKNVVGTGTPTWLDNPIVGGAFAGTSNNQEILPYFENPTYTQLRTRFDNGTYDLGMMTNEMIYTSSQKIGELSYPDDETLEWAMCPIGVFFTRAGYRGRKCELRDMWRCGIPRGSPLPDDGSRLYMGLGGIVVPWDGASNLIWK